MAFVDWSIKGPEISTCNCAFGCPCQFNALPTYGDCRAGVAMRIDEGHFGDVRLDGVCWVSMLAWPGAIHEGRGEVLTVIDDRTDEAQRNALLTVFSGEETEPGATIFSVFSTVIDTVHAPLFKPITFEADIAARTGHFAVSGLIDGTIAPIRNPVSGESHRVRVTLPNGFEYHEAEYASSTTKAELPVTLDWADRHGHLAMIHMTSAGPVH